MKTGDRIKEQRKKLKIKQTALAIQCDFPQSTLSNYENNVRQPGKEELITLAKVLSTTPAWLQFGDEEAEFNLNPLYGSSVPLIKLEELNKGKAFIENLKDNLTNDHKSYVLPEMETSYCLSGKEGYTGMPFPGLQVFFFDLNTKPNNGDAVVYRIIEDGESTVVLRDYYAEGKHEYLQADPPLRSYDLSKAEHEFLGTRVGGIMLDRENP